MRTRVIVSRHAAAVEFIHAEAPEFADAPVLASASPEDVRGKVAAGNLPLQLAALAAEVWAVEFDGAPPRGAEYGISEMRAAGARLARYRVEAVAEPKAPAGAILHTLSISGSAPTLATEVASSVRLGNGRPNDRHNRTVTAELTPGRQYLLIRDSRWRGRGPGNAIKGAAIDACGGKPVAAGWSGHPDHDGEWLLYGLPAQGIDITAGDAPPRRLTISADGSADLVELAVRV